jgi:transcriptional regulator with XRE-family HTH domain
MSMTQLADVLELGVSKAAIEKWENNQNRPSEEHRSRIVEFLGFDPAAVSPTGDF